MNNGRPGIQPKVPNRGGRNDMGNGRAEEECELERETGFEPATLALAILKRVIS